MLKRQNGCWNQHCHLFAVGYCFKSGTNRNFGFPKTHIAANEPIHRNLLFHVFLHGNGRFHLVGRVFVYKRSFQFLLKVRIGRKSETTFLASGSIQLYQFFGNVFNLQLGTVFQLLPRATSQFTDAGFGSVFPLEFRDAVKIMNTHEQHIVIPVA